MTAINSVYLDVAATTPLDEEVAQTMNRAQELAWANPASFWHEAGRSAQYFLNEARQSILNLLGASETHKLVFTSGATEANNMLAFHLAHLAGGPHHVVTSIAEHKSLLAPLKFWHAQKKINLTVLPVNSAGLLNEDLLACSILPKTRLVSLMLAHNETGIIFPLKNYIENIRAKNKSIWIHSDVVQAVGHIPFHFNEFDLDFITVSAHKMYGPRGIGALVYNSQRVREPLIPFLLGGGQEDGQRAGTPCVVGAVGLAKALQMAILRQKSARQDFLKLKEGFLKLMLEDAFFFPLTATEVLPHIVAFYLDYIDSATLLTQIQDFALSTGSACAQGEASAMIKQLAPSAHAEKGFVRVGFSRSTTWRQVQGLAQVLKMKTQELRLKSIDYQMDTGVG